MGGRRRGLVIIGGLFLGLAALAQIGWRSAAMSPVRPGLPYAVEVARDRTSLDLDFTEGSRYLMVVSSLGRPGRKYSVRLNGESQPRSVMRPIRSLEPWQPALKRGGDVPVATSAERRGRGRRSLRIGSRSGQPVEEVREFHIHVTDGRLDDPRQYARVSARLLKAGKHVRLYLDGQQKPGELAPGLVDEIVRLLDEDILPKLERRFGSIFDVDGDGTFAILLTPWLGRLQGGRTSLGGFVRRADFRRDLETPLGNRCDMLYLNSSERPGPHLRTLLIHELTHAICFSERLTGDAGESGPRDEDDWISEAIAHLAENLEGRGWTNLDYRISRYLSDPQRYPLVVPDYYSAGLWRNHGCRGATFLFLRWCVDQYGESLLRDLIRSPARGTASLEQITGVRFAELYRRWSLALLLSGLTPDETHQPVSGRFQSTKLLGSLNDWGLAGPRRHDWNVTEGPLTLELSGTSTAFVELTAPASQSTRRISVSAERGTDLQVSIVRIPKQWPRIQVQADWLTEKFASQTGSHRGSELRVRIVSDEDQDFDVELIACEHNVGKAHRSCCFSNERLKESARRNGRRDGVFKAEYHLPITASVAGAEEVVVKVVVRDRRGSRATGWVTLRGVHRGKRRLQVAETSHGRTR